MTDSDIQMLERIIEETKLYGSKTLSAKAIEALTNIYDYFTSSSVFSGTSAITADPAKPTKIWEIWTGEYSDATTVNFCYSEEEAAQACAYLNTKKGPYDDDYYYDELDLYTGSMANEYCTPYSIMFDNKTHEILYMLSGRENKLVVDEHKSTVFKIYDGLFCPYCGCNFFPNLSLPRDNLKCYNCDRQFPYDIIPKRYKVRVLTKCRDLDHACKIAEDDLAKFLAEENNL